MNAWRQRHLLAKGTMDYDFMNASVCPGANDWE